jgi:hypothetical protein
VRPLRCVLGLHDWRSHTEVLGGHGGGPRAVLGQEKMEIGEFRAAGGPGGYRAYLRRECVRCRKTPRWKRVK